MFYDNYLRLCDERGETPTAVAKKMGCASSNLAMWKKGSTPRAAVLQRFADYFGVSTQSLLFGETNEKSSAAMGGTSLQKTRYQELNEENRRIIDQMIEKLVKSQFDD